MLGLSEKEKAQILSINLANDPARLYKEVWIGLGGVQSAVYATEVSAEEYLTLTPDGLLYCGRYGTFRTEEELLRQELQYEMDFALRSPSDEEPEA